ncbi:tetratricopeptide repeat protein [Limnofasciculus baicalensis]|uniref:Tetratricopeptide repeat protein n=1 Tax=Limnofasciculus baicalensis BBK-W-15 TaxID=2699891 RepID=A0AAE3GY11_9CYAN|nr:tetratricopeptide repeat protein [Limnofasciculus baicalensis]MCP2730717.1 tetratricopeptide repeat protein [Limnofasciculus baicalensis BBK-W-15]
MNKLDHLAEMKISSSAPSKSQTQWSRLLTCFMLLGLSGGFPLLPINFVIPAAEAQALPAAVRQGYALLEKGLVDDAIRAFEQFLRSNPQSLEGKLGLAIAYQRRGRNDDAWNAYNQVLAGDPNNQTALKAVGEMGVYKQEWQARGIEALTGLLNLNPNSTTARSQRALLLGYQGRFPEALADYQLLLANNPSGDTILGAAQIYTYSGDFQQGLILFKRYQALGKTVPSNAAGAYALALRETGSASAAVQILETQLRQSQKLDSTTIQLRADLAQSYSAAGQLSQALAILAPLRGRADAALPLARALTSIGRKERRTDLYQEGVTLYRQVLKPNSSFALVTEIANVFSELPSEKAAALDLYEQLLQQEPNNRSLVLKRLTLASQLGRISRAELQQQLNRLLQPLPTDKAELRAIATALVPLDPPDPALLSVYQSLIKAGVNEPFLHFRVAQIFIQENKLAEAKDAIAAYKATSAGASDLTSELLLAEVDRRENKLESSASRYQKIMQSNPNSDLMNSALRGLAGIRLAQGRADDAIAIYDQLLARNPNDLQIKLGRSAIAYQGKRISEAEAEAVLDQWLKTRPANDLPSELFSLVGALPASEKRESLYNALLEVDPDNTPVQLRRLQLIAKRDPKQALILVDELIARNPDNISPYFIKGELALLFKDYGLASQAYREILQREPDNIGALMALGGVKFTQQLYLEAKTFYNRVLEISPGYLAARQNLAELNAALDQPFTAVKEFKALNAEQEAETGTPNPQLTNRVEHLEVDILKRRGFQPYWERY